MMQQAMDKQLREYGAETLGNIFRGEEWAYRKEGQQRFWRSSLSRAAEGTRNSRQCHRRLDIGAIGNISFYIMKSERKSCMCWMGLL